MLDTIKSFFEQNIHPEQEEDLDHQLKLATAALLIEMMQQDHKIREVERETVRDTLQKEFDLTTEETDELFRLAAEEADDAVDYHQFTSLIARHCSQEQKIKVVEYLWRIAYSDRHLDALEEHMIRRLADLIYVSHRDFIQTRHKVEEDLQIGNH
ncbi:MAG TPA: TerB family tellurite resistance protein [Gammaproteobacteria bacterium]|nr:TerB family tellurite resistance protein [Gammaproteobacteria bacterium]